ncbi:MAG: serine/threonine protein kinase, partial [Actinobacteria bacterium]|nr:serine/threonine protein kinase [Actinomycetota bacterium]
MNDTEGPGAGAPPVNQDLGIPGLEDAVEIGRGGFGVVYRARQPHFNRTVAVKVLTQATLDDTGRTRFERERQALGTISSHPNIVTVFDSGYTANGFPYLVMEHLQGGSLADVVQRDGAMDWEGAVPLIVKVAGALATVHAAGILHRDIKPENILISAYGEPHLGDFGIARILTGPETRTGGVTTSVAHAAPEILGGGTPSVSSDLYALASTLFTLLDGRPAFVRDTDETVVTLIGRISLESVPDLRPRDVPDAVCRVIEQGMSKEKGDRQASAEAFGRQLQEAQRAGGAAPTAMLLEPPEPSEATGEEMEGLAVAAAAGLDEGSVVSEADETRALSGVTPQPPGAPPPGVPEPTAPQPPAPQPPAPAAPGAPAQPPGATPPPPPGVPPAAPVGTAGGPPGGGGGGVPKWVFFVVPAAVIALVAGILVVSGGGDDEKKEKKTSLPTGKTSIEDVKLATVQIIANGTFIDPEFGETEASGA